MKHIWMITLLLRCFAAEAQEEVEQEDAMENMVSADETSIDKINEPSHEWMKGQLNINKVDEKDLSSLGLLTPEQIHQFILYRNNMGNFISLYELQAVPYWDEHTTRKVIPYFKITTEQDIIPDLKQRFKEGEHMLLYRTGGSKSGFGSNGSTQYNSYTDQTKGYKQLLKYQYQFRTLLQWGVTIEKDAGEKSMADYIGYYVYLRKRGMIKSLVMGDYVVNMGQGLIEWQGYAFGQSSNIVGALRQGDIFKPHTGSDENRYHKGIAFSLEKKNVQLSLFAGREKIDANVMTDTINQMHLFVSSFLTSGLHRTPSEISDKNALTETVFGGRISIEHKSIQLSLNHIQYLFNIPIEKRWLPYNYHAPHGKYFLNTSIDIKANVLHTYLFGEMAMNKKSAPALLVGCMKSFDPRFDASFIFRTIDKAYTAFQPNALIRNGNANNETGVFMCMNFQPDARHRIEAYRDQYINTWPTYFNDGIRRGQTNSLQCIWRPNKKTEMSFRYTQDAETKNTRSMEDKSNRLSWITTKKMRLHISFMPSQHLTIRQRIEWSFFKQEVGIPEKGSLYYLELIYKPMMKPYSVSARTTVFQTDSYNTRIYAYERDLLSYYSIPAYFEMGISNYLLSSWKLNKHIHAQIKYIFNKSKGDGMVWGNTSFGNLLKKEWRMQWIWEW